MMTRDRKIGWIWGLSLGGIVGLLLGASWTAQQNAQDVARQMNDFALAARAWL